MKKEGERGIGEGEDVKMKGEDMRWKKGMA